MSALGWAALVCGLLALARYLAGLPLLAAYLRRASIRRIPRGETPPLSLLVRVRADTPGLEDNLVATLRQNYPLFEVVLEGDEAPEAVDRARARVPDIEVRRVWEGGARNDILVRADPEVRPDPLYLRDVANGLQEADSVAFLPVVFGARSLWARALALSVNTDRFLAALITRRALAGSPTTGRRRGAGDKGHVIARRAARMFVPRLRLGAALRRPGPALLELPALLGPPLLVADGAWGLLVALWVLRAFVGVVIDYRFCWDRSTVRSLWLVPLLWLMEPLWCLAGATVRGRRARLGGS